MLFRSPGVFRSKRFEDQLLQGYGIKSVLIDYSVEPNSLETPMMPGQVFLKKWLAPVAAVDSVTLESVVRDYCGDSSGDLLLQMDIEGNEYACLASCPPQILQRFRIIVLELHLLENVVRPWRGLGRLVLGALSDLAQTHTCVHLHPNNCQPPVQIPGTSIDVPQYLECTFLRNDRFDREGWSPPDPEQACVSLPNALDIINVPSKPPLWMGPAWSRSDADFIAELRSTRLKRVLSTFVNEVRSFAPSGSSSSA